MLQLRVFEHDAEQVSKWIVHEGNSLAHEHIDIGDSSSAAELRKQSFEDFRNRLKVSYLMTRHERRVVCVIHVAINVQWWRVIKGIELYSELAHWFVLPFPLLQTKHHELSRVCTMGERLTAANHYAADVFRYYNKELKGRWENLVQMAEERATLLALSVSFHQDQEKVGGHSLCFIS